MKTKLTRMTSILLAMLFLIAMFPLQAFALDNGGQGGNDAGELQWICVSGIHSWNAGEVTTAPTCEGVGVRTFTCTLCGKTKTENISALEHNYDSGVVTTPPTCTETGVKTYTCQNDSTHSYTETIPALGHTYGEWTVTKEPTCAEAGSKYRVCSTCEHVDVEEIATLEHTLIPTAAVAATCTTAGNSAYWTCSVCGKYFSDANGENEIAANSWVIAATGHTWVAWQDGDDIADFELKAEATTESAAVYYKNCSVDGTSAKGIDEDATFTYGEPLPEESDIMYGDANGDGNINGADAVLLNRYIADIVELGALSDGADVNGDGNINGADAVLLNRYIADIVSIDALGPQS